MNHISFESLGFILFLLATVTFAAIRGRMMLATICTVSLVCAPLLGHPNAVLFGHFGYTGAIFFSVAMFGVSLGFLAYGSRAEYNSTGPMTLGLFFVLGVGFFLNAAGVLTPAYEAGVTLPLARLCSAAVLQPLYVFALRRHMTGPQLPRVVGLNFLILVLDAIVLFPLAFHGSKTWQDIVEQSLVSVGMRVEVLVASIPFLMGFVWLRRKGYAPTVDRLAELM